METYRTQVQLARMFRVGIPTVRRYIRSGELPAARIGRSYVISGADIDAFVCARRAAQLEEGGSVPGSGRRSRRPRPRRR